MQQTLDHVMLNRTEFADKIEQLGYSRHVAYGLFSIVTRNVLFDVAHGKGRSSDDIAFREVNRAGEMEAVISVPNLGADLAKKQDALLPQIDGVGEVYLGMSRDLVGSIYQNPLDQAL